MEAVFGPGFAGLFIRLGQELGLLDPTTVAALALPVKDKTCTLQKIDTKKVPLSKKPYKEVLSVIPDPIKPDVMGPTENTYGSVFQSQIPYNYAVEYKNKDDINILLNLSRLTDPTEKLWLKKLSNDMKIKYLAAQTYMLKHYHLRAFSALSPEAQRAYKARVENFNTQPQHVFILRSVLTDLFTNFNKEIYQTKNYMDRLNGPV